MYLCGEKGKGREEKKKRKWSRKRKRRRPHMSPVTCLHISSSKLTI
jgi:hypothetical protein